MKAKISILAAAAVLLVGGVALIGGWLKSPWANVNTGPNISGPLPKIAADETMYNFGTMPAGTEKSHSFVIRNEGDAPLHIIALDKSCKCTKGSVAKQWLQPGETTTVDVTWKPDKPDPNFEQILSLETNDPRHAAVGKFKLIIKGGVDQILNIEPATEFKVGEIVEDVPTVQTGRIYTRVLDKFEILDIVTENKLLTGIATPLDQETLTTLRAKSGYEVTLTLAPGIQVGSFKEKVTVKTDVEGGTDLPWFFSGERYGPFRILPAQGWSAKEMRFDLGRFNAEKGRTAKLKMLVTGLPESDELQFLDVHSDLAFVKLDMKADPTGRTPDQKRYWLTFEVAPGSPPVVFEGESAIKIHVKTNHPKAEQLEFKVAFVSL